MKADTTRTAERRRGRLGKTTDISTFLRPESELASSLQRSANVGAPGLVTSITAVAYHFCPSLPAAFTQPGASIAVLCTYSEWMMPLTFRRSMILGPV